MTTAGTGAPYRVSLTFDRKRGLILLDQIRTLDQRRLIKRLGKVNAQTLRAALSALTEIFAP